MRKLENWIAAYLKYTEDTESPSDFHFWSALGVLSAVLRRKVRMDMGFYKLYPNLFIVLVAESALCRKSAAIDTATHFLRYVEPDLVPYSESATAAALTKHLASVGGDIFICPRELSMFISSVYAGGMQSALTRFYDCPEVTSMSTISRGTEIIYGLYPVILGAMTPQDMEDIVPERKAGGGFISRFVIVRREEPHKMVARPVKHDGLINIEQHLANDIKYIGTLSGEYKFSRESAEWYDGWYAEHWEKEMKQSQRGPVAQGYFARKHDLMLKVAMLIQIARSDLWVLEIESMQAASEMLSANEEGQMDALYLASASDLGIGHRHIKRLIMTKEVLPREELVRAISYKWGVKELNDMLATLQEENLIKEVVISRPGGGRSKRGYTWTGGEKHGIKGTN